MLQIAFQPFPELIALNFFSVTVKDMGLLDSQREINLVIFHLNYILIHVNILPYSVLNWEYLKMSALGTTLMTVSIFMNSENSKTSKSHVLVLKLSNKVDLRIGEKVIALSNLSIYYTWKNIKSLYNSNKFKISAPTWNDKFKLADGSYSVSDIEDYFEYILKKQGENTDKPSVEIYVNKIENRVTFKNRNGYSLELLASETMKLLGSTENKIA